MKKIIFVFIGIIIGIIITFGYIKILENSKDNNEINMQNIDNDNNHYSQELNNYAFEYEIEKNSACFNDNCQNINFKNSESFDKIKKVATEVKKNQMLNIDPSINADILNVESVINKCFVYKSADKNTFNCSITSKIYYNDNFTEQMAKDFLFGGAKPNYYDNYVEHWSFYAFKINNDLEFVQTFTGL